MEKDTEAVPLNLSVTVTDVREGSFSALFRTRSGLSIKGEPLEVEFSLTFPADYLGELCRLFPGAAIASSLPEQL